MPGQPQRKVGHAWSPASTSDNLLPWKRTGRCLWLTAATAVWH